MASKACQASATVRANTDTQSSVWQAGSTPRTGTAPSVGFSPTRLLSPAGIRPEPAVSVPSAKETMPRATATAEPDEEPPGTIAGSKLLRGTGKGVRTPTSPVANWSRLVLPIGMAPAARRRATAVAVAPAVRLKSGQAAVVATPARSMLSLMAKGSPHKGRATGSNRPSAARARAASRRVRLMKMPGSSAASSRS